MTSGKYQSASTCSPLPIGRVSDDVRTVTVLPAGMGYIIEGCGNAEHGYRLAFGSLAAGLVLGASVYLRSRDGATASPA